MKIIKTNSDIFAEVIHKELNKGLVVDNFPCTMKLGNVTPVCEKGSPSEKGNYRAVITLPNICDKVFKNGPSEICGRQPFKFFKGCLPQISLGSFLNTLLHIKSL